MLHDRHHFLSRAMRARAVSGNFQQKKYPVNPIKYLKYLKYLKDRGINSVFRLLLTHPDMDHMDGIKDFFETFEPANFYDTENTKEMNWKTGSPYRVEDWNFYKSVRDGNPQSSPKRIPIYPGDNAAYRTQDWSGNRPGDSFYCLAPTPELVRQANDSAGDYHDASYVILYHLTLYVTHEAFARAKNPYTYWSASHNAWFVKDITGWDYREESAAKAANSIDW